MKGNELKPRIGIFGRRNHGKSSLINYLTGQEIAIVSATAGATTDPVRKTMEIGGVGPVVWVDTAGLDDEGELGRQRVEKSLAELKQCDLAVLMVANNVFGDVERNFVALCRKEKVAMTVVYGQSDRVAPREEFLKTVEKEAGVKPFVFNVLDGSVRETMLGEIRDALPETAYRHRSLLGGVIGKGDRIVMVTPIDSSAPEGRMILPQVQVLRDILDNDAIAIVCKETELEETLRGMGEKPSLVVTDSQVFGFVSKVVPEEVRLTSFSVVLARAKGLFEEYVKGTPTLDSLKEGDRVLMLESCTHNVTCEDIGRVKLPRLIEKHAGCRLEFDAVAGLSAIERPLTDYRLVIQCGGCVVTPKQLASRLAPAIDAGVPVSNYGMALAYLNGIFERAVKGVENGKRRTENGEGRTENGEGRTE
ncbi:MAG: [FeFe] hydrogenase H-cluster maturation GTPase HydF [Bacteroidales bacterium]|nr:[FeFe] hydrogenase H-cluster maturation GTPase HydF [Bacteroidales bacterium]